MATTATQIVAEGLKMGKSEDEIRAAVKKFRFAEAAAKKQASTGVSKTGVPTGQPAQKGMSQFVGPPEAPEEGFFAGIKRRAGEAIDQPGEALKGAGKGILSTLQGISTLGQKGLQAVTGVAPAGGRAEIPEELTTPKGGAQEFGFGAEQLAEFFVPAGGIVKGQKAITAATKGSKIAGVLGRAGLDAATTTGIAAAQSGELGKEELLTGAFAGVLGEAGRGIGKALTKSPTKKIQQAIQPRIVKGAKLGQVGQNFEKANNTLVELGFKPTDVKSYYEAVKSGKNKIWGNIDGLLKQAGEGGATVDLSNVAKTIDDFANTPGLSRANKTAVTQIRNFADDLIGAVRENGKIVKSDPVVSILEAENIKQQLNESLKGLYGELSQPKQLQKAMKLATRQIGNQLDDIISKATGGKGEFKALKEQYGALRSIEDDVLKRAVKFEAAKPESLLSGGSKIISAGRAIKGVATGDLAELGRAATEFGAGQLVKRANDANLLVKSAFEDLATKSVPRSMLKTFFKNAKATGRRVSARELAQLMQNQ